MAGIRTVGASEFKAKCLEILDRVRRREFDRVIITKRGVAVAMHAGSAGGVFVSPVSAW
jgi:hypothetical protein